jgi:iron only hydrogenase large subunit-like protein
VAEKSARFAIDDSPDFCRDLGSKDIVALVAPSAQSNFNVPQLITALKTLGIKAVYDVALGAEITVAAYHEAIKLEKVKLPVIAQPCPAVVNYIELHHPSLIEHLAPVGSPVHNLAVYVRTLYPDAELAFISPCLAKRREFRDSGMVKYNVTFQSLLKILHDRDIQLERLEGGRLTMGGSRHGNHVSHPRRS